MKIGDLVRRVVNLGEHVTSEELEHLNRVGTIINKTHEPFVGFGVWNVYWSDNSVSSGLWCSELEVINASR